MQAQHWGILVLLILLLVSLLFLHLQVLPAGMDGMVGMVRNWLYTSFFW